MKTLIKDIDIITMSKDLVISNGYIGIDNEKIVYVNNTAPKNFEADKIIDGNGKLAIPGLVNSHTHSPMTLLRSYADDLNLEKWLFDYIFPIEEKLTGEDVYWGAMLGIAEMLKSGTTCFLDMYFYMDDIARAVEDTGIRACLSRGCQKFDNHDKNGDIRLKENIELYNKYHNKNKGLITVFIGPHSVYTCTPDYLKLCFTTAKELQTGLHIHLSESQAEVQNCIDKYGCTPIEHCYNLGILNSNVIAAHCVHPTEKEIEILAKSKVSVVHNPTSNFKLASGIAPVLKFLESSINVCIGTDGASSNNNLNMFEEMHLTGIIHKGANYNAQAVNSLDTLRMATINGSKALGYNDIGMIKEGFKADITILDIDKPHFYPRHNIISNLIYSAQGSDVYTVLVNGEILIENGQFTTIDFEKLKFNIDKIFEKLF